MLKLLPVCDLLGKNFIIPAYQRGYRWEKEQIAAFMDDLYDFSKQPQKENDYYCMQPIVVVPEKDNKFVVVDGQQRLTTINLILNYIYSRHKEDLENINFILEFASRPEQKNFMQIINLADDNNQDYLNNIDYFYLKNAWNTIKNWYRTNNRFPETMETWRMLTTKDKKHLTVLWNEITDTDAVNAFRRLNYGKIQLESAEIVKALLFQSDCYPERERMSALATSRALEWDKYEKDLADPYFAGMLGISKANNLSGIGVILDFVADEINVSLEKPIARKTKQEVDLFNYHVINKYLNEASCREKAVEKIWKKIQDTYNKISNWYKNRDWYHIIGLYSLLYNRTGVDLLKTLAVFTEKADNDKTVFADKLRKEIGKKILIPDRKSDGEYYPDGQRDLNCPDLHFYSMHDKILQILTAFNVWLVKNDSDKNRHFPFHLYREQGRMTLEHIHPQSMADDIKLDYATCKDWLREIKKYVNNTVTTESEVEAGKDVAEDIANLDKLLAVADNFDDANIKKAIKTIEDKIYIPAKITLSELHSIKNLALINQSTNSRLKNYLMDTKRKLLVDDAENGYWIPPGTEDVFAKRYSAGEIKNMEFWLPEDRQRYLKKLDLAYKYFVG